MLESSLKLILFLLASAALALNVQAKTLQADWALMSYVGYMQTHAQTSMQQSADGQGISFPGLLVYDDAGALVWAGSVATLVGQAASVLRASPKGSAKLRDVLPELEALTGAVEEGRPTMIAVILGGVSGEGCAKCATVFQDLQPLLASDGREWNLVEASVAIDASE